MIEWILVVMVLVAGCAGLILPIVIFAVVLDLKKETNVSEVKEGSVFIGWYQVSFLIINIQLYKYWLYKF